MKKVKHNRAKLKKAKTSKEYNAIRWMNIYGYDMWEWGCNFRHGDNMENHKWRSYRTWKHNRKTRWK